MKCGRKIQGRIDSIGNLFPKRIEKLQVHFPNTVNIYRKLFPVFYRTWLWLLVRSAIVGFGLAPESLLYLPMLVTRGLLGTRGRRQDSWELSTDQKKMSRENYFVLLPKNLRPPILSDNPPLRFQEPSNVRRQTLIHKYVTAESIQSY